MRGRLVLLGLLGVMLLAGCSRSSLAPVRDAGERYSYRTPRAPVMKQALPEGKDSYRVKSGDTLYAIAWMYGLDFRALASYNNIASPYNIYAGQTIRLDLDDPDAGRYVVKKGDTLMRISRAQGVRFSRLVALNKLKKPYIIHPGQLLLLQPEISSQVNGQLARTPSRAVDQSSHQSKNKTIEPAVRKGYSRKQEQNNNNLVTWRWPTQGSIIEGFSLKEQGNKGIDIRGSRGQPVLAAAGGRVVYAGSALRGYGNLVIIKHDEDYLSAYAHNEVLRVSEQQEVKAGQRIADMGSSDAPDVRLHFEIRYRGKSVNPVRFLPKR